MKKRHAIILSVILTILLTHNEFILSQNPKQIITIKEIIDGDTFKTTEDKNIRLANINTPEKNEHGYEEAKTFLQKFENKEVEIEILGIDKYGRILAKVFTPDYLNLKIVDEGLATKFLVQNSETNDFAKAEKKAIENEKGIWKKSQYFNCFESKVFPEKELVTLKNNCQKINFENWILKDESRKRYKFHNITFSEINIYSGLGNDTKEKLFWQSSQNVWNNDRDSFYLIDSSGFIAHYNIYGY